MTLTTPTAITSLEDRIQQAGGPVAMMRDAPALPATGPLTGAEFSNWRDEETGWRQTAALFDLSHHMTDLTISGPDSIKLLSRIGVNSMANFAVGKAKQFVAVNDDGYLIGDGILDYMADDNIRFSTVTGLTNWIQYHIETGDEDVAYTRDEPTASNPKRHPEIYRYHLIGPAALDILEKVLGGPVPEVKFFNAITLTIGGREVRALAHNMARAKGFELQGPWEDAAPIMEILLQAGAEFDLKRNGSRAPGAATLESGWIPTPVPAIYSGASLKAYREWLPADSYEGEGSLGGSFYSDDISDFYMTPHDFGYDRLVKFDHDFIGREALESALDGPHRRKVTLEWNRQDVVGVFATMWEHGDPAKYMEFPIMSYSTYPYDKVLVGDRLVGVSMFAGYNYNERATLSLAPVDSDVEIGSEVVVVWGEEDGGSRKPQVERHVQTEIRATVCEAPYSQVHWR